MHPLADSGRVIAGRYRLEAPVGRGAMGVVWRARDQLLDRDVAVKEVRIADTLTESERANAYQRTLREAKTAARLNHPGVVTVYDVAEDEGRPWIVMQLVSALSLDQVLATSGPLSPRRTAEVGRQLLDALSVAHAAGVMHRDVKPSNVLLARDDRAVLTDFGIATFTGDPRLTQTGMVMGSPGYTAPERIRGEDATPASDLWSLGATLFAAVEGHGPFEQRGGAVTTMSAIINEDAPTAATAGALGPVIAALLRREPADRPDAITAARMMTDVLPLLADRKGAEPAGYSPTALSAPAAPASPPASPPFPPASPPFPPASPPFPPASPPFPPVPSVSGVPGGQMAGDLPGWIAGADTSAPGEGGTAPTKPQPVADDAARADEYQPTQFGTPGGWGRGEAVPAAAPPDFSSWYDRSPRSGSAGSGSPAPGSAAPGVSAWSGSGLGSGSGSGLGSGSGSGLGSGLGSGSGLGPGFGAAAPSGATADYGQAAPRRRRSGLWWKIALVLLVLLGAGAGAAVVVLVRHGTTGTPLGSSSSSSATLASPANAPQIVNAINEQNTGPLPAGWHTVTHQPTSTENAGFTIASPADWAMSTSGYQTYLTDPSATQTNILIDLTPHTYPNNMLREAQYIRNQSLLNNRFPGYVGLGIKAMTIRGTPGAWWKFTWDDNGINQEAIDLLFVLPTKAGPQSYALYMTAPASAWSQMRPVFDEEVETFAALS